MTKLTAVHEIVYTNGAGKRAIAAPGTDFDLADRAQIDLLLRVGAAREARSLPAAEVATLAGVQDADGATRELSEMTKAELLEIAKGLEIEGLTAMNKAELVAAIQAEEVLI